MAIKNRVLVLGINCFPELTGIGKYSGEMVQWLGENGYETTMITTPPYYPNWKVQKPYSGKWYKKEKYIEGRLTIYRCPLYVPANPSGLKRLIHEATFFLSAFFVVFKMLFQKKHELIFAIAPPFHLGFLALFYRFFKGGKIVYHIQDLQIDAAKELKMLPNGLFSLLFAMERYIMNRVNYISTISEGMLNKVGLKTSQPVTFFPNWVDTIGFHPLANRNSLKTKWDYDKADQVVLYSGSIGEKQGLDSLIRIADKLREHVAIKFLICGIGPYKQELMRMTDEKGLTNVRFLPFQDYDVFNEFLNMADIHLVLQKANASDLVMPSKLTAILSVGGLALVTANPGTTLHDVMEEHQMGVVIPAEEEEMLAGKILNMSANDYDAHRANARRYAAQYLDKNSILPKMISDFSRIY